MNTIETTPRTAEKVSATQTVANACIASCRKLVARFEKAKASLLIEFRETLEANERLLRLAFNEAEALAWQTEYPHLLFPALAAEKAQAVAAWGAHQRAIRHESFAPRVRNLPVQR